jgi:hypothetical protein
MFIGPVSRKELVRFRLGEGVHAWMFCVQQLGESPGLQAGEYATAKDGPSGPGFPNPT